VWFLIIKLGWEKFMKRFLVLIGIYIIFVSTTAYAQYSDYKRTDGRALAKTLAETAKIRKGND